MRYIEIDEQHAIFEVGVPEGWIGKSVGELDIRRKIWDQYSRHQARRKNRCFYHA